MAGHQPVISQVCDTTPGLLVEQRVITFDDDHFRPGEDENGICYRVLGGMIETRSSDSDLRLFTPRHRSLLKLPHEIQETIWIVEGREHGGRGVKPVLRARRSAHAGFPGTERTHHEQEDCDVL